MQRRNQLHYIKTRPKLVIERPANVFYAEKPSDLGKSISISKLVTVNKENEAELKNYRRHSLKSLQRVNQEQPKPVSGFNIRTIHGKIDARLGLAPNFSDGVEQNLDYKSKIEGNKSKIQEISSQSKEPDQTEHRCSAKRESKGKQRVSTESRMLDFSSISSKKAEISQHSQEQWLQPTPMNSTQSRVATLAIQNCFSEAFLLETNPKTRENDSPPRKPQLGLQSGVVYFELWEQAKREEERFVFAHLTECNDYILLQPNKILHEACRRHKYLEEELFAYADLLSLSHLGANTYTPEANIQHAENQLDRDMRRLNRELVQGQIPLEDKSRLMRDYVLQVRQAYAVILQELMTVIDEKTEQARVFVFKVLKWEENYLARKEFLGNLKKEYSRAMFEAKQALRNLEQPGTQAGCRAVLEEAIGKINRIYMLGNSFY